MIYDGDCGFCRRSVERLQDLTGQQIMFRASQELHGDFSEIPTADFEEAVQFIDLSGRVSSGAEAIMESLRYSWMRTLPLRLYRFPPFAAVSEALYRSVARNRGHLSRVSRPKGNEKQGPGQ
jgi:predicted DCC family thiol-disulfide oxidoreductase YuxK